MEDRGEKLKAIYKLASVSVIAVVLTAGFFYFWTSKILGERGEEIASLREKIVEFQGKLADKSKTISSLEGDIDNTKKFWWLLLEVVDGNLIGSLLSMEAGRTYYDEFLSCYEEGYYEGARYLADKVDGYFGNAMTGFVEAKAGFMATKKYAPDERSLRLVENYIDLCEYAIDMTTEMHHAGACYSNACGHFAKEQWSLGGEDFKEGDKHIAARNDLIDDYNDCWANIDSLLEE